jgi:hypothetical protein
MGDAYFHCPLKKYGLATGTLGISESADRVGRFIVICGKQIDKTVIADCVEKVSSTIYSRVLSEGQVLFRGILTLPYIYGPGRSFNAWKQRQVSSTRTGPFI